MKQWKHLFWQLLFLGCFSGIAGAQTLGPSELVSLRKASPKRVDSLMKAKGFSQASAPSDSANSGVSYVYQGIENGTRVQRLLLVGWHHHSDFVELEYDVWQQKDALGWEHQLLKAGFQQTTPPLSDTRGKAGMTLSVFRKNNNSIYCQEQTDGGSGRVHYKFGLTTRGYKADTL
jgi:hypothetical protein